VLRRTLLALVVVALWATAAACARSGATNDTGAAAAAPAGEAAGEATTGAGAATIDHVVDGDTVRVRFPGRRGTESVRLIGIDTPETHGPGGLRECFGQEAAVRTARLLPEGTEVRLVRDEEARDRYGRLLAYVYRSEDGLFVNLSLAKDGFAAALSIEPNTSHRSEIVDAVDAARDAGLGLWGKCGGPDKPL
jgi:micrococcal nuclease